MGEHTPDLDADDYGSFPLRDFLGMDLSEVTEGRAVAQVHAGPAHLNPNGVVHGAVLFAMVDTAMGGATMSVLEAGRWCASVDVQLRFVRPAGPGPLRAEVEVLKRGRHVVHLEGRVLHGADTLTATAAGTFAVLGS